MKRKILVTFHRFAGIGAFLLIASFFFSTVYVEIFGNPKEILAVKRYIVSAILAVGLLMPVAAFSGAKLGGKQKYGLVSKKMQRMRWIAINGIALIVLAIMLYQKAKSGVFDIVFWAMQAVELVLGFANLVLLAMMIRDGLILSGKIKRKSLKYPAGENN